MKAVVAAFNQEKALVGAFSVITNLRMELFEALVFSVHGPFITLITSDHINPHYLPSQHQELTQSIVYGAIL